MLTGGQVADCTAGAQLLENFAEGIHAAVRDSTHLTTLT